MDEGDEHAALIQAGQERFARVLEVLTPEGGEPPANAQSAVVRLLADALHHDASVKPGEAAYAAENLYRREAGKKWKTGLAFVTPNARKR